MIHNRLKINIITMIFTCFFISEKLMLERLN